MSPESMAEALKRLVSGQIMPDDLSELQQAVASGRITIAAHGGVAIAGNVSTFILPPEAAQRLVNDNEYNEELERVLNALYADKRSRNQQISRADLFCSLVRCRIDKVDSAKLPRVIAMLDDFDRRLNPEPSAGKFEVTDAVNDLLSKARLDRLGVVQLMEALLEDSGENIKKGLDKHGFAAEEILIEMKCRSCSSNIFSDSIPIGNQP